MNRLAAMNKQHFLRFLWGLISDIAPTRGFIGTNYVALLAFLRQQPQQGIYVSAISHQTLLYRLAVLQEPLNGLFAYNAVRIHPAWTLAPINVVLKVPVVSIFP